MRCWAVVTVLAASGCSVLHEHREPIEPRGPRLAELAPPSQTPTVESAAPELSAQAVADWYGRALGEGLPERERRAAIERLAALRLVAAEDALAAGEAIDTRATLDAIGRARAANPDDPELAYLQAHALELAGDPDAARAALDAVVELGEDAAAAREARFRLAEAAFSAGRWKAAARAFAAIAHHPSELGLHATYMHGWARFKAGEPELALQAFLDVLERLAGQGDLAPSMQELRGDVLRVLVFTLGDLEGATTLAQAMAERGRPAWQLDIYEYLAGKRREQERTLDAARVLEVFVAQNPVAAAAPRLALQRIEILRDAGISNDRELDALRAGYVEQFGAGSEFAERQGLPGGAQRDALVRFCTRLARAAHVRAQETRTPEAWLEAARWDERRIANSPGDAQVPVWLMLAAEAYEQAAEPARAAKIYERLLAGYPEAQRAPDAAYALTDLYRQMRSDALQEAERRFIEGYPGDARAPAVAVALAKDLYDAGERLECADLVDRALERWDLAVNERTARELAAAARLELGDFQRARNAYAELLAAFGDGPHAADYRVRWLASTERLAEAALASGENDEALNLLASMLEVDAEAEITVAAQFRRVEIEEQRGALGAAAQLLRWIRERYPDVAAKQRVDARLAEIYERDGRPGDAAEEYARIAGAERYPNETRRLALFRAAELARSAGEAQTAARRFEAYLARWPEPVDYYAEALAERIALARASQADIDQWLEREVAWVEDLADRAPAVARERAARAAMELAEAKAERFYATALGRDLAASLVAKRDALTTTFEAYQRAAALGVAEVTTVAGYRAAALFEDFATALLESPRPELDARAAEEYELLLEEQAFPFEERAIELHTRNVRLIPVAGLDEGTRASLQSLARLSPARWKRKEMNVAFATTLY